MDSKAVDLAVRAWFLSVITALMFLGAICALLSPTLHRSAGWVAMGAFVAFACTVRLRRELSGPRQTRTILGDLLGRRLMLTAAAAVAAVIGGMSGNWWSIGAIWAAYVAVEFCWFRSPTAATGDQR